ncbi:unnamed protein product [Pieris macdunnoughi]|uniref:Kazal-like domain-containing protein n=1 Tax=Pieris macdunnoughi TaxID=345717 RepID=A0A821MKI0_9NEOP|nr:unnamed protein product [Pieris macdunnoughi]
MGILLSVLGMMVAANLDLPNKKYSEQEAELFQEFYYKSVNDSLPLLEEIKDCDCPRIYMPVCASDNKTYTNLCWMNCAGIIRKSEIKLVQMGQCVWFLSPFDY